MTKFHSVSDEMREMGYISKDKLLEYVTEAQIFEFVFGFEPIEFEYIHSPLRKDNNPGCWFEYSLADEKLQFRDFGDPFSNKPLDCFDVVQRYYNIPNFYETLNFIKVHLIDKKGIKTDIKHVQPKQKIEKKIKEKVKILIKTRDFNIMDKLFWKPYGITKKQLIEDKVFPISAFIMKGTRKGNIKIVTKKVAYAYTDFPNQEKKVYQPYNKKNKFSTNCTNNSVGGYNQLPPFGRQLIITKSYKDFRVLKNQGLNVVWFQNEGQIPSKKILEDLASRFQSIIVFFDSDETGLKAATKVANLFNAIKAAKARTLCTPIELLRYAIKDPADLYKKRGREVLRLFLKSKKLI
jgi:5S rRNA maturation endonuclease (ribonuclease M5)